jgi:hypothetical protein
MNQLSRNPFMTPIVVLVTLIVITICVISGCASTQKEPTLGYFPNKVLKMRRGHGPIQITIKNGSSYEEVRRVTNRMNFELGMDILHVMGPEDIIDVDSGQITIDEFPFKDRMHSPMSWAGTADWAESSMRMINGLEGNHYGYVNIEGTTSGVIDTCEVRLNHSLLYNDWIREDILMHQLYHCLGLGDDSNSDRFSVMTKDYVHCKFRRPRLKSEDHRYLRLIYRRNYQ